MQANYQRDNIRAGKYFAINFKPITYFTQTLESANEQKALHKPPQVVILGEMRMRQLPVGMLSGD
jgi:hypothetical protein